MLASALWAVLLAAAVPPAPGAEDLALGMRQVGDGDFEAALLSLDSAVRALALQPGPPKELGTAYLYLGLAYVGLKQESLARTRFQQALEQDSSIRLDPNEFPRAALRAFDAAVAEHRKARELEKGARTKRAKGGAIVLAVGGVAAGGVAWATSPATKSDRYTPPTISLTVAPEGQVISGVTVVVFTVFTQDPEGRGTSYQWVFGDGAEKPFSPTVSHVFGTEGTFQVQVTVSAGEVAATAATQVTARFLTGEWRPTPAFHPESVFRFQQSGRSMSGEVFFESSSAALSCDVSDPRQLRCTYTDPAGCLLVLAGNADAALGRIDGTVSTLACGGAGRSAADRLITLTRP